MLSAQVIPEKKALLITPNQAVPQVIPETHILPDGRMVVPHDVASTRMLRNLKYKVPSPIHYGYDWNGTTPFMAQKATAAMLVTEPKAFVLSGMGSGKTRAVLYAYDYLRKERRVRKMLVVAPLSTLRFTWGREVFQNFPKYRVGIVHGTKAQRLRVLEDDSYDIYVINHDGPKVLTKELIAKKFDIICIDEVSVFRNARSQRHKLMAKVLGSTPYVWGLTGTPTPREPTDAFGIIKLIQPHSPYISSFMRFRDELMIKASQFRYLPRPGAQERVYSYMQPAVRFTLADCADIPPIQYSDREVTLSPRQKAAYLALKQYCQVNNEGSGITAANAGVLLNKLLQVSAGCVYDCEKHPILLDAKDRLSVVLETVMETENKAIVFVPFVPLVDMVGDYLASHGVTVSRISGATSTKDRDTIFSKFQDTRQKAGTKEVIVAHPGTMSHGLTLTAADLVVWYSPISDLEIYEQANARIARPGQTSHKVQVVHLVGTPVDRKVYTSLRGKKKVQGNLLDLFID